MAFIQNILLGIPQGALYGLMAFGIALIFKTVFVMNFAHGSAGMMSAFFAFSVYSWTQNLFVAIIGAMVFGFILAQFIERFLMRPVKHLSHGAMLIITLGLLMIFEGLAIIIWGTEYEQFPQILGGAPLLFELGDNLLVLPMNDLINMIIALSVTIALALFLKFTKLGTAIRARSQDEVGASVVGININKVDSIVWGIGIALAALVAVLASPKTFVHPGMMTNYQLYGFTAGVLGGFYNLFGAIVGGLLLGIMEKLVGYYISPDYQLSIILILIIIVLVVKPTGLFGSKFEGRV